MKSLLSFLIIFFSVIALSLIPNSSRAKVYHSKAELRYFENHFFDPVDPSLKFPTSTFCSGCHGFDEEEKALIDLDSNDVNIFDDWSASMMALSAKDPFWRAKVSHEVHTSPNLKSAIENKCTSCHAPMGHSQNKFDGHTEYLMEDLMLDTMGLDGVSCGACHQLDKTMIGRTFSGDIQYDTTRTMFGPYPLPFEGPMLEFVGFKPKFSDHVFLSEMCASCHTLITETISPEGEITGDEFVEQATYHEWLNSRYSEIGTSCQSCHMPYIDGGVVISSGYTELVKRSPFALHQMTGANTMMLNLMNTFRDTLEIVTKTEAFDENILATRELLQSTLETSILSNEMVDDSLVIQIELINKAGHKFPSGYPARRAWIECLAVSHQGDTIFHSGKTDKEFRLVKGDVDFEPHRDVINDQAQVQVYEMVNADINLQPTTILTRAFKPLKDNRLPPLGFTTSHQVYDTTQVVGHALTDENFNFENQIEGSGGDLITYKIDVEGFKGLLDIEFNIWYQSIPPEWTDELFLVSNPTIDLFRSMYDSLKAIPELVNTVSVDSLYISTTSITNSWSALDIQFYPNPIENNALFISGLDGLQGDVIVTIIDQFGRVVSDQLFSGESIQFNEHTPVGLYHVTITQTGKVLKTGKVIKLD